MHWYQRKSASGMVIAKEPTCGYRICNSSHIIGMWWVCQGERIFCIPELLCGLMHFETRVNLSTCEGSFAWCIALNRIENKTTVT